MILNVTYVIMIIICFRNLMDLLFAVCVILIIILKMDLVMVQVNVLNVVIIV